MTRSLASKRTLAFTLIELLIVVAIIAILAAIAVPNFLEAQTRSKVSRSKADMRSFATAVESYYVDNNVYPPIAAPTSTLTPRDGTGSASQAVNGPSVWDPSVPGVSARFGWVTTPIAYITSAFKDPFIPNGANEAFAPCSRDRLAGYDTYDYTDARSFTPQGVLADDRGGGAATSGAGWRLVGAGPDGHNAFGGGIIGVSGVCTHNAGVDYDPTNGTLSAGDLVRIGGGPYPYNGGLEPAIDRVQNKYYF